MERPNACPLVVDRVLSGLVLLACRSNEQAIAAHLKRGDEYQANKQYAEP